MKYYVFTYGSLKRGFENHDCIARFGSGVQFLGEYKTKEAAYRMRSFRVFPAVGQKGSAQIKGELYRVNEKALEVIDQLESNGSFYQRELVSLEGFTKPVWMYLLLRPLPSSGTRVRRYTEKGHPVEEWE